MLKHPVTTEVLFISVSPGWRTRLYRLCGRVREGGGGRGESHKREGQPRAGVRRGPSGRTSNHRGRVRCPNENCLSGEATHVMSIGGQTYFHPCFPNHHQFRVRSALNNWEGAFIHVRTDTRRNPSEVGGSRFGSKRERHGASRLG